MSNFNRMTSTYTRLKKLNATLGGVALGCILVVSSALADDTEVFFGQVAGSSDRNPNVLFVFDTSTSMNVYDGTWPLKSRLDRLKEATIDIIDQSKNMNVGLMRFNGGRDGGAVIYPVTNIDAPLCDDGACEDPLIVGTIQASEDDVVEDLASSVVTTNDLSIDLAYPGGTNFTYTGLHFKGMNIPQGAKITSAELLVTSAGYETALAEIDIQAEQSDSAAPFTGAAAEVSSRVLGTSRRYSPGTWNDDEGQNFDDLEDVIQEVVDRPGWCGGNDLNLVISGLVGERSMATYDQFAANASAGIESDVIAPTLRVRYNLEGIPATAGCALFTTSAQVSDGADDSSERESNGYLYPTAPTLYSPFYSIWGDIAIGMRFPDLEIPQGATIGSAYIELTTQVDRTGPVSLGFQAEAADDAEQFEGGYLNRFTITNRPTTGAPIPWPNVPEAPADAIVQTPDLSTALQAVVNRSGWTSGNATVFIMRNNGTVPAPFDLWSVLNRREYVSYNGSPTKAPRLIVSYQANATYDDNVPRVRDKLKEIIADIATANTTPITDTYYEAALYMTGGPVTYGTYRGDPTRDQHRVSHPLSYTGGTVYREPGCTDADLNDSDCRSEVINGSPQYISPITSSCQANHIVLLADGGASSHDAAGQIQALTDVDSCAGWSGAERCGRELAEWMATEDMSTSIAGDQHITTYTIGFNTSSGYLKALGREYGGGDYFEASESDELLNVFKTIFASVQAIDTSFVAPGATVNVFNRLTNREDIYFALFKPSKNPIWDGNLKRYRVGLNSADEISILDFNGDDAVDPATGFFYENSQSWWSGFRDGNVVKDGGAAGELNFAAGARNVYTFMDNYSSISALGEDLTDNDNIFDEDNNDIDLASLNLASMPGTTAEKNAYRDDLINWARGVDIQDTDGDGSTSDAREYMGDPMHSRPVILNYASSGCTDPSCAISTVFIGTNEGFLHAFDHEDGEELFSFMPRELLPNLRSYFVNQASTPHPYGLDGTISFWSNDPNNNATIDPGEKAMLYVGMRRGGSNYYAFDVSDRENPKLSWVIEGGIDGHLGDFTQMGQTWGQALPINITYDGVNYNGQGTNPMALLLSAGYDTNQDPAASGTMTQSEDNVGRGFYIVNAETGDLIYSVLGVGGDQTISDLDYSVPSNIRALDTNGDKNVDQLYFGDMGGQIWRFDVKQNHEASDGDLFTGGVIADLSGDDDNEHRRFYYEPDTAIVTVNGQRGISIAIGSGWRAHPLNTVVDDRFYVLFSNDLYNAPDSYTTLYESDLTDITNDMNPTVSQYGWYLDMGSVGEKVLGNSITVNNQVIFSSYRPEADTDACQAAIGGGAAYTVNILNGAPTLNNNGDSDLTIEDRAVDLSQSGIPSSPTVLITENGPTVLIGTEQVESSLGNLTQRTFWFKPGDNTAQDILNSATTPGTN